MTFSNAVKREIYNANPGGRDCRTAFLAAVICTAVKVRGGAIILRNANARLRKRFYALLRHDFGIKASVDDGLICVTEKSDSERLLTALGLWENGEFARRIDNRLVARTCCKKAYLAGVVMGCGYVLHPGKAYHAEFGNFDKEYADELSQMFGRFGLSPRTTQRKGRRSVSLYFKDGGQIAEILNISGAHEAYMFYENVKIRKSVSNTINRAANFNASNVDKAIEAAVSQIESINLIDRKRGLSSLPGALEELARVRLENPEISLTEIGEKLSPPLSKSAVNHRLRKIKAIAGTLEV